MVYKELRDNYKEKKLIIENVFLFFYKVLFVEEK